MEVNVQTEPSETLIASDFHPLLRRQIRRHLQPFLESAVPVSSADLQPLLESINRAYRQMDSDREMVERSLEISSQELLAANTQLQEVLKTVEAQVEKRTLALSEANQKLERTIQELRETQIQLIQTEKMSSLGQLVAGIAHEINNPVNFISGNLGHASTYIHHLLNLLAQYQSRYPLREAGLQTQAEEIDLEFLIEDLPRLLISMNTGAERIRKIVLSLRSFSRMDEADLKAVDIHEGIESTLLLLQHQTKRFDPALGLDILREYGQIPPVECYVGQLNQVMMNLLSNAIDAVDQRFNGAQKDDQDALQVSLETAITDDRLLPIFRQLLRYSKPTVLIQSLSLSRDRVGIVIADNGCGIHPDHRARLFDPFFTTKPVGQGTGLGLSISYQVIRDRHQGTITCESILDVGTAFLVEIPIHQTTPRA